jgi:hypothetical protein
MFFALLGLNAHADPYRLEFNFHDVDSGDDNWDLVDDVLDSIDDHVPLDVQLTLSEADSGDEWVVGDNDSDIVFDDEETTWNRQGVSFLTLVEGLFYECDVWIDTRDEEFDNPLSYDDDAYATFPYGGEGRNVGQILMHEFGHCFRLGHEDDVYNLMGAEYTYLNVNDGTIRYMMGEHAADKLLELNEPYYDLFDYEDISVSSWRWIGSNGAYSSHGRTRIFDASSVELPLEEEDDQPIYTVRAGTTVRPEFTYEANGTTSSVWFDIEFRLSTNDNISTSDPVLTTQTSSMSRGVPWTMSQSVAIPSGQAGGDYYLGAMVHATNVSDENDRNDKAAIRVLVLARGSADYCRSGEYRCPSGQGDCDTNADCASGLTCAQNVGASYGFSSTTDVCR